MARNNRIKRKPKKIYRTVIKFSPPDSTSSGPLEPKIEIASEELRPKLLKSGLKPSKPKKLTDRKPTGSEKPLKLAERYDEALIQRLEWAPVTKNTRWVCIRCGWCCSHEWRVNLTWDEYDRLKDKLPISEVVADPKTGMSHPFYMITKKCAQYDRKSHKCKIYKIRAYSCATYPFALTPKGKLVRSKFCKGFGSGETVNPRKMKEYIIKRRKKAGMKV
jgi:Fe-S-cluster containining protein